MFFNILKTLYSENIFTLNITCIVKNLIFYSPYTTFENLYFLAVLQYILPIFRNNLTLKTPYLINLHKGNLNFRGNISSLYYSEQVCLLI